MRKTTVSYVCDRCGNEYLHESMIRNIDFNSWNNLINEQDKMHSTGRLTLDMCDSCAGDFMKWWNDGGGDVYFEGVPRPKKPNPTEPPVMEVPYND